MPPLPLLPRSSTPLSLHRSRFESSELARCFATLVIRTGHVRGDTRSKRRRYRMRVKLGGFRIIGGRHPGRSEQASGMTLEEGYVLHRTNVWW